MTSLFNLQGGETVLEVGSGSGYQAAVLSLLAKKVFSVELVPALAEKAQRTLASLGYDNVVICQGDGSQGLPEYGPYGGILVAAAAPVTPQPLLEQLLPGARLVIPVGRRSEQILQVWERLETGWSSEEIVPVAFVPLRGALGWKENEYE